MNTRANLQIHTLSSGVDLSNVTLNNPIALSDGTYLSKLSYKDKAFYFQLPKAESRGKVEINDKKAYFDLIFTKESSPDFIEWIDDLEETLKDCLYDKKDYWFEHELDYDDIEESFADIMKYNKKSDFYTFRIHLNDSNVNSRKKALFYNEDKEAVDLRTLDSGMSVVSIIEIRGVKLMRKAFKIDVILKQAMIIEDKNEFMECQIDLGSSNVESSISSEDNAIVETVANKKDEKDEKDEKAEKQGVTDEFEINVDSKKMDSLSNIQIHSEPKTDNILEDIEVSVDEDIEVETPKLQLKIKDISLDEKADDKSSETIEDKVDDVEEGSIEESEEQEVQDTPKTSDEDKHEEVGIDNLEEQNLEQNTKEEVEEEVLEKPKFNSLEPIEINIDYDDNDELQHNNEEGQNYKLKRPQEVYYELYKIAKDNARKARDIAIQKELEAENIKNTYMLEDIESSDDESDYEEEDEDFQNNEENSQPEIEVELGSK